MYFDDNPNAFECNYLMKCVISLQEFDFNELEKATEYEGGYTEKSQIIIDFWDIVHGLSLESKKKLLEFTTGRHCMNFFGIIQQLLDTERVSLNYLKKITKKVMIFNVVNCFFL